MRCALRFAFIAMFAIAMVPARGEDAARPVKPEAETTAKTETATGAETTGAIDTVHCLDQKERRAESDANHLVRLSAAMRVARARMPGTVVRARLCRDNDELVYVLTVLAHDGKVARLTVDAVKGTLVGGL
jgi:uncharacterized membrane protein YkoI